MSFLEGVHRPLWYSALPLVALWVGMPLWWALGLQKPIGLLAVLPVAAWLVARRHTLEVPTPLVLLLGFMAWALLSAISLTQIGYGMAWFMRVCFYVIALVIGLYTWNALRRGLSARLLIWSIVVMWVFTILLAFPGMFVPGLSFTSPTEWLLHAAGIQNDFLNDASNPQFSEWDQVYGVARPSALFAYTNEWGAAMGVMTPFAVYAATTTSHRRLRLGLWLLIGLSAWPVLASVNRGCWISIGVAVLYVVLRRALAGDLRSLGGLVVLTGAGYAIVMSTPLADLLADRFAYGNTSTRSVLYQESLLLAQRSPVIGYGAPQSSAGIADSNDVSIGTHGQLWALMVSHGFVGTVIFVVMLLSLFWYCRPASGRAPEVWLHAVVLVLIVQLGFYEVVPDGLAMAFVAAFSCAILAGRFRHAPFLPNPVTKESRRESVHA